jgi:hypothetical protein
MPNCRPIIAMALAIISISCSEKKQRTVIVTNHLPYDRREVVKLDLKQLNEALADHYDVFDGDSALASQVLDSDDDSIPDALLIYITVKGSSHKEIRLNPRKDNHSPTVTYARFVPERTDDYAWENDRVAFRTYGPVAQKLVEEGKPGGTLSSGIDCWLKRVDYPIIDKWYEKYVNGGSYHQDDGEGYDPFHVGRSRGCGGIGVWKNDSLYVSKNFISYRKIMDGPIRTVFELSYTPWQVDEVVIEETKRITIDAGEQLFEIEEHIRASGLPNLAIGLTLHDKPGAVSADTVNGIFTYWETVDDSELGTAIMVDNHSLATYVDYRTPKKDLSHLLVMVRPETTLKYYTGFAWKKAGKIRTAAEWHLYLQRFRQRSESPLTIEVKV